MKAYSKILLILGAATIISACDVEQTREGEMPEVSVDGGQIPKYEINKTQEGELPDVNVEGGQAPAYDIDGPEVSVGTETREVTVPTVDVDLPDDDDDERNQRGISGEYEAE